MVDANTVPGPDYRRLPARVRIEDTIQSQPTATPYLPDDDLLRLTLSQPTDRT